MRLLTILILSGFCMSGCLSAKNGIVTPSINLPVVNNQTTPASQSATTEATPSASRFYYPVYINDTDDEKIKNLQQRLLHRYGQTTNTNAHQYYYPLNIVVN